MFFKKKKQKETETVIDTTISEQEVIVESLDVSTSEEETLEESVSMEASEAVIENEPVVVDERHFTDYDHKRIDKDIRYKGPLTYRYLRIIGWLALAFSIAVSVAAVVIRLGGVFGTIDEATIYKNATTLSYLSLSSSLPLPLFLLANFCVLLQGKNDYKKLIKFYGGILIAIYIGFLAVYYNFVVSLFMKLGDMGFGEARVASVEVITSLGSESSLVVNVFIDLFMCVLIMFFIDYDPKKHFQGKKIILFRLLVLLPILYEFASTVISGLVYMSDTPYLWDFHFVVPPEVLPLLGKKPVLMIFAFLFICIYVKRKRTIYIKRGGSAEGYEAYLKTNRNSLRFALITSLIFFVIATIDLIGYLVFYNDMQNFVISHSDELNELEQLELMDTLLNVGNGFTLGKSICLYLVIPFVLLLSYLKQHKNPGLDKFVPLGGIGLIVITVIETFFIGLLIVLP